MRRVKPHRASKWHKDGSALGIAVFALPLQQTRVSQCSRRYSADQTLFSLSTRKGRRNDFPICNGDPNIHVASAAFTIRPDVNFCYAFVDMDWLNPWPTLFVRVLPGYLDCFVSLNDRMNTQQGA